MAEIGYHVGRHSPATVLMTKLILQDLPLDSGLLLGLEELGVTEATDVQTAALPPALAGRHLRISAETGTGKTLAYLIPAAERALHPAPTRSDGTLALVLVPTRELARQVLKVARSLFARTSLRADAITGGADFKYQRALLRKNPELVIATPGRLLEHCEKGSADLAALRLLVLDEADRMLDLGFREEVLKINSLCPAQKQTLLLSATLGARGLGALGRDLLTDPVTITTAEPRRAHGDIFHQRILADSSEHKERLLTALLQAGGFKRALVFANKRRTADRLAGLLRHHQLKAGVLHGELSTELRKHVVTQFSDGKIDILCASDVAARGLDIADIDLVINFDLPHSGDDYVHRTGRTGRAGASGLAVSLVSAPEWNLMISIQRYLQLEFEHRNLPGLKARFTGPRKQKKSGKSAGSKKSKAEQPRKKARLRDKKAKGKPRRKSSAIGNDGFAPLTRRKPDAVE